VRKAWGLENLKKDVQGNRLGDKHHAVDALVCALLSEGQRRFVTVREQEKQTARLDAGFLGEVGRCYRLMEDENDHRQTPRDLPLPWSDFRNSVVEALDLFTVSRRENCKGRGGLHNDTIYRVENENGKEVTFSRRPILDTNAGKPKSLFTKLSDLDKIKDIHSLENRWLKAELTRWIESGSPVEPENLPRDPQGTLIRKVTVALGSKSGRKYPQGFVSGGNQVRVDIFSKTNRRDGLIYYIVPVYSHHLIQDAAPSKAITRGKDEAHWDEVDASFHFEFSLWPNSRFRVVKPRNATKPEGEDIVGLYSGVDRNTMAISFADPEDSRVSDRVSVKTGTEKFQKLYVDRLGRETVVKSEKRTWRGKTVE
jgi:CRISPR/Cas system Type II protein with McrA/HNH and RuvC-like nuclease domain